MMNQACLSNRPVVVEDLIERPLETCITGSPRSSGWTFLQLSLVKLLATHMCSHWLHHIAMKKDVGMRVRVDLDLREEFLAACRSEDR